MAAASEMTARSGMRKSLRRWFDIGGAVAGFRLDKYIENRGGEQEAAAIVELSFGQLADTFLISESIRVS